MIKQNPNNFKNTKGKQNLIHNKLRYFDYALS